MKNLIKTTYGLFSIVGIIVTLYIMFLIFKPISSFDGLIKMLSLFIYIPIFLTTIVVLVKGLTTVLNDKKLFIGNIFKYEHTDKEKERVTKNTTIIGVIMLLFFLMDIGMILFANLGFVLPYFTITFMKILSITLMINTVFMFLFGVYRIIME